MSDIFVEYLKSLGIKIVNDQSIIIKNKLNKIYKKFKLSEYERSILADYVKHIHPESKQTFVDTVLAKDRKYLDDFLDTDLEDLAEELFENQKDVTDEEHKKEILKHIYTSIKNNSWENIAILYSAYIQRISELDKETREKVYEDVFDFYPHQYTDKKERRSEFYTKFISYAKKLKSDDFVRFVDSVFDRNSSINYANS